MNKDFWLERWRTGQTGFHQESVNAFLRAHWHSLGVSSGEPVLVPLCGKSLDMHWLRQTGHSVLGIELSRAAVEAFFHDANLTPVVSERGGFTAFQADRYTLLCGDFFAVTAADLVSVRAVYDRAALVALPPEMRRDYARALTERLPEQVSMLLVTFEYDQNRIPGPPFAVLEEEVRALYAPAFTVERLERRTASDLAARFKDLGEGAVYEAIYRITRP